MSRVTATECAGAVGTWREHEVAKRVAAASVARRREGSRTFSCSDAGPADMKPPGREPNIKSILLLSQAGGAFDTCRNGVVCGAQGVACRPAELPRSVSQDCLHAVRGRVRAAQEHEPRPIERMILGRRTRGLG